VVNEVHKMNEVDNQQITITHIDTRGSVRLPLLSLLPLMKATATLVFLLVLRKVDVVHINLSSRGSTIRKSVLILVARVFRTPVVVHLHASSYPAFLHGLPKPMRSLVTAILRRSTRFFVLGEYWRRFAIDEIGLSEDQVRVVRYGVPGPEVCVALRRDAGQALRLTFLGRLGERKGVAEIISAIAVCSTAQQAVVAVIAGDGDVAHYEAMAEKLGVQHIISFPGWLNAEAVRELLGDTHVLLLPSRAEGLPLSVIEAFANSVPVIVSTAGALGEIVVDGENALIIEAGSVDQIAGAIQRLANDEDLRRHLAVQARLTWEESLSVGRCTRQLVDAWREAAGLDF
jgi:glycosyltransferase involved in cell wall biosynthesis